MEALKAESVSEQTELPPLNNAANWESWVEAAQLTGMVKQLAIHCAFQNLDNDTLRLLLSEKHAHFLNADRKQMLENTLIRMYGSPVRLDIQTHAGEVSGTPAHLQQQRRQQRLQEAEQALKNDDCLQQFLVQFDAKIVPGSIESLDTAKK